MEMNLHAPQSVEAATELREIAAVPKQLISPRLSKPLVSVVQDTLVGVNRLTRPTEFFTLREYMNLLVHSKRWDGRIPPPAKTDPIPLWSGQQVVSALLPAVHLAMGNKVWDEKKGKSDPNYVVIRNGTIEQGVLDGDVFDKALIHILYNDFSPEMTVDFLDSLQAVVATYLQNSGFSVGLSDIVADSDTLNTISTDLGELKRKIESLQLQVHMGLFDNTSGRTNQEEFEGKVFETLDKVISGAGKTGLKSLSANNRMVNMVKCGSKGSDLNIAQMIAVLGQQSIEGKRIAYGFQDRTLPHFKRYDDGAEARGFIESSFVKGLNPAEFFFHAMTGREGLIDTAVKSVTGDTPIVVMEEGVMKRVFIGEWIDTHLEKGEEDARVEHFTEREMELLQLTTPVYIPTTDADGRISWGEITAITRHDPGKELFKITTQGGKSVIVTESKSLLIYNAEHKQFERMSTPDVKPGHFVPVTMNLPAPPIVLSSIPLESYLPKSTFLYGTEFEIARDHISTAMKDRKRIPAGWWNKENGTTFTLPYRNKGLFQRALRRSDISNIRNGFIYPFTTNRSQAAIPDSFELTNENGIFLGLFLAEGNVDRKSGYIEITNNNKEIRSFVTKWFSKFKIMTSESSRINKIGGTTTSIRGYSTVLGQFLTAFVGHGARNKFIPSELFGSPEDFIVGLLNGYISGDGTLTENSIEVSSASSVLIEGISMLFSRLGIFGKIFTTILKENNLGTKNIAPTHRLAIRAQWASRFSEKITLLEDDKNRKLLNMNASLLHRNFKYLNDVVLDKIINIEIIDVTKYPKVYDLTVPSTLNFGLANGLHVVDTADSGYMQRQLVKTMEDLMTYHDGTVRDAGGLVVQFAYGDDGTSATKIENQPIGLGRLTDSEILEEFTVKDAPADLAKDYLDNMYADRDILVQNVWGGRVDKTVQSAVHLPRLVANAVQQLELRAGVGTPVSGEHVLETIGRIRERTSPTNRLWGALLRFHLNPNRLVSLGFTRAAFDWLAEQIVVKHMRSWVVPGEMSGIIAAQSLGEPTTQMSCLSDTIITIGKKTEGEKNVLGVFTGTVGVFVDNVMSQNKSAVVSLGHGSEVLDLPPDYVIMGVSTNEKTSWKPISQISRHPANGGLVKVTTRSGRNTTATLSHSFLRRSVTGITSVKGSELKVGQRIPVATHIPESPLSLQTYGDYTLTKEFGWLCGIYLADGSFRGNTVKITKIHSIVETKIREIGKEYNWKVTVRNYKGEFGPSKETIIHCPNLKKSLNELCGTGSYTKRLSAHIFHANKNFIAGVLSGYFDGDGNVNVARQQIRVGSRSEELIRGMSRLLAVCSVFATIGQETTKQHPDAVMFTANVLRKHADRFQKEIGLSLPEKKAALEQIVAYNERDDVFSQREDLDKIPELGPLIAETGKLLRMPGNSRTYGRWAKKESIGRRTLETYISNFREMMAVHVDPSVELQVKKNIAVLESARDAEVLWDEITYLDILPDPKENVYDFTVPGNDSFMVDDNIFVHNTLNSVDWDTEILIAKDGVVQAPRIGEFIDNYIEKCDASRVQQLPNDQLYVALDDGHDWKAVSCDAHGTMMWTKLEAITKHPVVNEDGTNTILEVELESGRRVKATRGRSFITFDGNSLVPTLGSDLKIGDLLPIANNLAVQELPQIASIDVRAVLPATEYLYGSEVEKALVALRTADRNGTRRWFGKANGNDFTVPYNRSDTFRDAFVKRRNQRSGTILPGFVYPKSTRTCNSQIPDTIPLTRDVGFFIGAFLSEGSTSDTQIQITNNEDAFLAPIRTLMDSWKIGHHTVSSYKEIEKTGIKGHTQSLIIHSTLLTAFMKKLFGRISYEKTIPDWMVQAPDECVKGLLDGYISGDGGIEDNIAVNASSVSEPLLVRIASLLSRFGIFCTHSSYMPQQRRFHSVSRVYKIRVLAKYTRIFAQQITLTSNRKQEKLNKILSKEKSRTCKWKEFNNMILDKVIAIQEIAPLKNRVYDITVEKTRNFLLLSGVVCLDTFHLAGVAAKSGMTRGVPRLKELLKVTQNPKATSLTIYLRPDLRTSKEEARKLTQELEFTMLKDIVTVSRIYYDPRNSSTLLAEDTEWLQFFAMFEQMDPDATQDEAKRSPWILRLEMDREKMFTKNITMEDIQFVLKRSNPGVEISYTDHNASRMIFRLRFDTTEESGLDDLRVVKQMQGKILTTTLVRGLPGLRSVTFRKITDEMYEKNPEHDNKYEPVEQFVLDTLGTNFLDVLIHPSVDGTRLISNHVHDIYENLGIEAARQILFREIFGLFEQAAPVNYRHVALLCDAMSNRGRLMSADRYGVNKKKTGPLAKASFEQTEDIMLRAALFGEMDPITGVSANIMTGQPIRGGTSFTQILLDEEAFQTYMTEAPPVKKRLETVPHLTTQELEGKEEESAGCRREELHMSVALPPALSTATTDVALPDLEIVIVDDDTT
jgi:DNA-directed RNA polymerase beta' subunit